MGSIQADHIQEYMNRNYRDKSGFFNSICPLKTSRKIFLLFLHGFLLSSGISAQNYEWVNWFRPVNDYPNDSWEVNFTDTDSEGNVYATGYFRTSIISAGDTLDPHFADSDDLYLAKFSRAGEQKWIRIIGGDWYDRARDLVVNDTSVFLAATIQGNVINIADTSFANLKQNSILEFNHEGEFRSVYFHSLNEPIIKLEFSDSAMFTAGNYNVCRISDFAGIDKKISFSSSVFCQVRDMHIFPDQSKLITGLYGGNLTFRDTILADDLSGSGNCAFLAMLDESDSLLWVQKFGKISGFTDSPLKIEVSSGNQVYLVFHYNNTLVLDDETIIPYNTSTHSLLACLDLEGRLLWHKSVRPSIAGSNALLLDAYPGDEGVYLAGYFSRDIIYDEKDTLSTNNSSANFIIKTDLSGNLVWKDVNGGSSGTNRMHCITSDNSGNVYAGGLSYGIKSPKFGCETYPDVTGGFLLHMKDGDPDDVPLADFEIREQDGRYYFFSEIENENSVSWDFDDGTGLLEEARNPAHSFSQKGEFNVCLTATNQCGDREVCKIISINGLKEIFPAVSGHTNFYTGEIRGAGFSDSAEFRLVMDGIMELQVENPVFVSTSRYNFSMDLLNAPQGDWNLIMIDGTDSDTLENAFNIEENTEAEIELSMSGPSITLTNRYFHYQLLIENKSNINIPGLPLIIMASREQEIRILNHFEDDSVTRAVHEELGTRFLTDTLETGEIVKIGFFAIPFLRAGESFPVELIMKTTLAGENNLRIMTGKTLLDIDYLGDTQEVIMDKKSLMATGGGTCFGSKCADCIMSFTTYIPVVGCLTGIYSLGCSIKNAAEDGSLSGGEMFDIGLGIAGTALSCGGAGAAAKAAEKSARASVQLLGAAAGLADAGLGSKGVADACGGGNCDLNDLFDFVFGGRSSLDPNEKYGLKGLDENNYIHAGQLLQYTITFENMDTATAPASEVLIHDTLDTNVFDLSSFEWLAFGFGDSVYSIPQGNHNYIADTDLRPTGNIFLRFSGSVDSTGLMTAVFASLDTATYSLTENILDGFLPPNVQSPEGEGFISFAVRAKEDLDLGTRIENKASIIFDANEAIRTGTWLNVVDTESPVSFVDPLPEISTDTIIPVRFFGTDLYSGIRSYDLFVSEDGGDFEKIVSNLPSDTLTLTGENGKSYSFYVIATDRVGNVEHKTAFAESSTSVQLPTHTGIHAGDLSARLYPVPAGEILHLELGAWENDKLELAVYNSTGMLVYRRSVRVHPAGMIQDLDTSFLPDGSYILKISGSGHNSTSIPFNVIHE